MKKQFILYFYSIILSNFFMVKSNESSSNDFTSLQNQLSSDVYGLKHGLEHLKMSVEVLNKRHEHHINDLKEVAFSCNEDQTDTVQHVLDDCEDLCRQIMLSSNQTLIKYQQFKDNITMKLGEINKQQTQRLDEFLTKPDLKKNCPDLTTKLSTTSSDSVLSLLNAKIIKIEEQLKHFEYLEQKLVLQQQTFEKLGEDQMKILKEIQENLLKNEEKFEKYQKDLPDLNNFSNKISNMASWKQWRPRGPR